MALTDKHVTFLITHTHRLSIHQNFHYTSITGHHMSVMLLLMPLAPNAIKHDLYILQIRAQDGLLQRYLHTFWKDKIFPGAMQKYWFEGNNANFVLLRMLVDKVEYMRGGDSEVQPYPDTTTNQFTNGIENDNFCQSFQNRGAKMWVQIATPYEKESAEFLTEFVDDGSEEEVVEGKGGEDDQVRLNPYFERPDYDVEAKFAEDLRGRTKKNSPKKKGYMHKSSDDETSSDEESNTDGSLSSSASEENQNTILDEKEDVESNIDDDIWMAGKKNALAKLKEKHSNKIKKLQPGKIRLLSQSQGEDDEIVAFDIKGASPVRSRIMESDDESSDDWTGATMHRSISSRKRAANNVAPIRRRGKSHSAVDHSRATSLKRQLILTESDEND